MSDTTNHDKLRYPVEPGMTCVIEPGMTVCGQAGYDVCGDPDLIGYLLHTQKYEVENLLLKQSDMRENLVEAVVSDIDKLRYPVEPGMTIRLGVTFEPGMTIRPGVILESGMIVRGAFIGSGMMTPILFLGPPKPKTISFYRTLLTKKG